MNKFKFSHYSSFQHRYVHVCVTVHGAVMKNPNSFMYFVCHGHPYIFLISKKRITLIILMDSDDCWYMCIMNVFFPTVVLNQEPRNDTVCRGTKVVFTCTTTTPAGVIRWQISNGQVFFDSNDNVGTTKQLGNITLNLTSIEMVSEKRVYTSTATLSNILQDTSIMCSDENKTSSRTVRITSKWHSNEYLPIGILTA